MGRRTYESIGRRYPDARTSWLAPTRYVAPAAPWSRRSRSVEGAGDAAEVCVIGARRYSRRPAIADVIHLTEVQADVEGDTYFPEFDRGDWIQQNRAPRRDERHAYPLRILRLAARGCGARLEEAPFALDAARELLTTTPLNRS